MFIVRAGRRRVNRRFRVDRDTQRRDYRETTSDRGSGPWSGARCGASDDAGRELARALAA
jgi:hypothetical protein